MVLMLPAGVSLADQTARELARHLGPQGGEVRWIQAGERSCMGLFKAQATEKLEGAAIIIPDRGQGPEWPVMVQPLRMELPRHGWQTLTLAIPLTGMGQLTAKTQLRLQRAEALIEASLAQFNDTELPSMYLVGRGWGAYVAAAYLKNNPNAEISGLVLVDIPMVEELAPELETSALLSEIKVPILDLYVEHTPRDRWQAQWRKQVLTGAGHPAYRQVQLDPTALLPMDQEELIKRIRGWMQAQAKE